MLRACRARCRTFSGARRATSEARALLLPQAAGLITLSDPGSTTATLKDVADNPLELEFREVEAVCAPGVRADVDIAVINTSYALEAIIPEGDVLYTEATDSPYVNVLVVKAGNENAPGIQAPAKAITSRKVADCINATFCGTVVATK
jgi:D-methionine transport system substrate-binding protein